MYEVKADALEASFDAVERGDEAVAALREEMTALRARVDAQVVAAGRPALAGAGTKSAEHSAFVDGYLRKGYAAGGGDCAGRGGWGFDGERMGAG